MNLAAKISFLLLFSMLIVTSAMGQRKNYAKGGDEAFEDKKYILAIEKYKKAQSKIKNNKAEKAIFDFVRTG